jgi:hypothetical protein
MISVSPLRSANLAISLLAGSNGHLKPPGEHEDVAPTFPRVVSVWTKEPPDYASVLPELFRLTRISPEDFHFPLFCDNWQS